MNWNIDPKHSSLTFGVRHMMVTTVRGGVSVTGGTLSFDPARPDTGSIEVMADPATITTGEARRDGHLRSADFFDAATYPEIRFSSTRVAPKGKDAFEVQGDLTIRGVTRPVVAEATLDGMWDDPQGGKRAGFTATMTIDRREWGLVWNQPIANGGLLVGENVQVELGLAAVQAQQPVAQAA